MDDIYHIELVDSLEILPTEHFGKFSIGPLDPGQGITLGNALRRILLSELKTIAITEARFNGITHEFSILKGVREDILEIILNLKEIIFSGSIDSTEFGLIKVQGPYVITANDLKINENIKVINPNQYIATIVDNSIFELQVCLETGKGYNLKDNRIEKDYLEYIEIDAIFMPVRKANFEIEFVTLPEEKQIYEYLKFEITTNGSISPKDSLVQASEELRNLLKPLSILENFEDSKVKDLNKIYKEPVEQSLVNSKQNYDLAKIDISELKISPRAYNSLKNANINTISDLLKYSSKQLKKLKNLGKKSLEQIETALKDDFSLTLKN